MNPNTSAPQCPAYLLSLLAPQPMRWEERCNVQGTLDDSLIALCHDLTSRFLHQLLGSIRLYMASGTKPHILEFEQHGAWGVACQ